MSVVQVEFRVGWKVGSERDSSHRDERGDTSNIDGPRCLLWLIPPSIIKGMTVCNSRKAFVREFQSPEFVKNNATHKLHSHFANKGASCSHSSRLRMNCSNIDQREAEYGMLYASSILAKSELEVDSRSSNRVA